MPDRLVSPVTEAAEARARRFERDLRQEQERENAIVIDNETGQVAVGRIRGTRTGVQFSLEQQTEITGRVVSHNHPSGWNYPENDPRHAGIGFSPMDILFFLDHLPAELRAVTPGYLHRLRPRFDKNGAITRRTTDATRHLTLATITRLFERVQRQLSEEVALGELSEAEAAVELNHRAMLDLQDVLQVEYEREVSP